jgi:hypothetical protein
LGPRLTLTYLQRNVETLKYPRILTPVLLCIEGPQSYPAILTSVHMHIFMSGATGIRIDMVMKKVDMQYKNSCANPVRKIILLPLLGGFRCLDLFRSTELRVWTGYKCSNDHGVQGNVPSLRDSCAPYAIYGMPCPSWARGQPIMQRNLSVSGRHQ